MFPLNQPRGLRDVVAGSDSRMMNKRGASCFLSNHPAAQSSAQLLHRPSYATHI